jgi:hypothetical protein
VSSTNLSLIIGNTIRYTFGTAGLTFSANNTYDIGTSANRAATIYATQLLSTGITGSIISASTALTASTIQIPPAGITDTTATNKVLVLDTATGQFFTTASVIPNGVVSSSTQFTSLTAPFTGSFTGSFTGRLIGTSSVATSASYALTASYAANAGTSGLTTKAGSIANTAFTGNPRKAPVNFSTPFATTNYAIVITGEDARSWNVEGKVVGGFTASSNSNTGLTGTTYWIATAYGET